MSRLDLIWLCWVHLDCVGSIPIEADCQFWMINFSFWNYANRVYLPILFGYTICLRISIGTRYGRVVLCCNQNDRYNHKMLGSFDLFHLIEIQATTIYHPITRSYWITMYLLNMPTFDAALLVCFVFQDFRIDASVWYDYLDSQIEMKTMWYTQSIFCAIN